SEASARDSDELADSRQFSPGAISVCRCLASAR
ncbi:hypothetical protein A2U01_0113922, partial [Trifolium medium]|nr:hypothetical protein [Trifolium medium]